MNIRVICRAFLVAAVIFLLLAGGFASTAGREKLSAMDYQTQLASAAEVDRGVLEINQRLSERNGHGCTVWSWVWTFAGLGCAVASFCSCPTARTEDST